MAFVDPTQPGQEENTQNPSQVDVATNPQAAQANLQPAQNTAPPSTSAGGAGVASTGGSGAGAPAASASAPKPSSSGSWTNLDSYLNANSDQATAIGQQLASNVNAQGNQAQSDINNLSSNFNNAVTQDTVNYNPTAVNQAISDAQSLTSGQTLSSQDQAAYNSQANATYGGPTDVTQFSGYNQAQQDVNAANQAAQQTESEAGRDVLLNNQFQNSSQYGYNQGEANLDQLLLENSAGAQSALNPLASQWSGLNGALNNAVSSGTQAANSAQATTAATAASAQNALGTATQNFQNQLNTGLANLQATDTASYNQILNDLNNGTMTAAEYQALGLDPTAHNYLYQNTGNSVTPVYTSTAGQYLTPGTAPTMATYATADQYAQAQALAQLAGQPTSSFLPSSNSAQAGTAQTAPAYNFNKNQYISDNAAAQAAYTQTVTNIQNSGSGWTYLPLSNGYHEDLNMTIPGALTSRRDLTSSTPQDIANYWIPIYQSASDQWGGQVPMYTTVLNQLKSALQQVNAVQAEYGLPAYGNLPPAVQR